MSAEEMRAGLTCIGADELEMTTSAVRQEIMAWQDEILE